MLNIYYNYNIVNQVLINDYFQKILIKIYNHLYKHYFNNSML